MFFKLKISALRILICLMCTASAISKPVWENNAFKIFLQDNTLELYHDQTKIAEILSFQFNFVKPETILIESSQTDSLVLKLLFNESDGFHNDFPSHILLTISQFNNTVHFRAHHKTFNHVTITMKDQNEHYFGLIEKLYPHNSKNPDLRGTLVDIDVYSIGNQDYAENYASAYSAFYISNLGYGSFFDTFAKGRYQLAVHGITELYHQTGSLDWYIFYGPTGDRIHREYFNLIGKPKYVPLWACGPIFWRDQNDGGKDEILDDIQKFTDLKIPLTACWVDRPYSHGGHEWSKMNFSENFSEPENWIKTINEEYGLEFMTWIGPMTFTDKDFPGLLPNERGYIDLTHPEALKEFEYRLSQFQYSVGVKGHKMDRADQQFPLGAKWHKTISESESRNKYVYLFAKITHDFLSKPYGKDQFNFARAAFHRCQPFLSAVWGGDSRSNWLGIAGSQANAMRCGFMGFPVWGQDTGGYLGPGRIDEVLYIRWLQWGVWNGMFEVKIDGSGGEGEDRAPWNYSDRLQSVFRKTCELRMQLLPYIYSCANTSSANGVLMKPLAYLYPNDENTYHIWDEYIFGNALLIAPVFTRENTREIYLPEGTWYEFTDYTHVHNGPVTFTRSVPLESTPVFIKANSIYTTGQIYRGNSKIWKTDITGKEMVTIHLFPGQINEQTTFQYIDHLDHDTEKKMILRHQSDKIIFHSEALLAKSIIELRYDTRPEKIELNKKSIEFDFNQKRKTITIHIDKSKPIYLEIY